VDLIITLRVCVRTPFIIILQLVVSPVETGHYDFVQ
jgi:hypothetical protein